MRKSFVIPVERVDEVRKQLDKHAARAAKLGFSRLEYVVGEPVVARYGEGDEEVPYEAVMITADVEEYSLAGWSLVARLEHFVTAEGKRVNIPRLVPGYDTLLPQRFRDCGPWCDHCQSHRRRKDTFVVMHEDGTYKQIGRQCVGDFLGQDASSFLARAECVGGFCDALERNEEWSEDFGPRPQKLFRIDDVLRAASALIHEHGFTSKAKAEELCCSRTSDQVECYLFDTSGKIKINVTDESTELAKHTGAWLQGISKDADNDYLRNLKAIAEIGFCPRRSIALLTSAPAAYLREQGKLIEAAKAAALPPSEWVGSIKKREVFKGLTVTTVRSYDSMYGSGWIIKFTRKDGALFLWFASSRQGFEPGEVVDVKATVKKHDRDSYSNDAKVTIVNRVVPV